MGMPEAAHSVLLGDLDGLALILTASDTGFENYSRFIFNDLGHALTLGIATTR